MDLGTTLSVAQTIFAALQCTDLRIVCSMLGYEADLKKLQRTVETIEAILLDAEAKKEKLSRETHLYIKKLKDAAYDADDLIDEFITLAQQKKLVKGNKAHLFSLFKDMGVAYHMANGIKKVKQNLVNIVDEHNKFGFSIQHQPIRKRIKETCSYIYANDIIGRDDDVDKIRNMLLNSDVQSDVSFLTITGIGGIGKTALTQLLYNDIMVKDEFPLRLWVCVADHDSGHLDVESVLHKILASIPQEKHDKKHNNLTLDGVQREVRKHLVKEKFLLVLDDVWTENRDEWVTLEGFLKGVVEGSWVLLTSRSTKTAQIVGKGLMYKLESLSSDNSWRLFERTAFREAVEDANASIDLVEIGKKIIKRCANVPLAIRAVGTLLYGEDKTKWERVLEIGLANIMDDEKGIMPILKLSYDNLEPPIKSCFSYCALFPKDFQIEKHMLYKLWMAQGYVVPLEKGQSIHDACEEYFLILLRRCFFQDVERNSKGEIISCKIHDLMHDIALEVSGSDVYGVNSNRTGDLDERARHVSVMGRDSLRNSFKKTRIRTYLQVGEIWYMGIDEFLVRNLLETCMCLRTLDLRAAKFIQLPDSIGKLLHLRYLDLSYNRKLEEIPKSITKLHNLIFLGIVNCFKLNHLPIGMGKLTQLQTLERFMVGNTSLNQKQFCDELEDLITLDDLRGCLNLEIRIPSQGTSVNSVRRGGTYLSGKQQLDTLVMSIKVAEGCLRSDFEEALLETLRPHSNLSSFFLEGYNGLRMPNWGTGDNLCTFLPNLVRLEFYSCRRLQSLSGLGKLRHLEELHLLDLPNLVCMEENSNPGSNVGGMPFFSRLKNLTFENLPELKTWWAESPSSPFLPQLRKCEIHSCPKMNSIPRCPLVEKLIISDNKRTVKLTLTEDTSTSSSQLRTLNVRNLRSLTLVPVENIQFAATMYIVYEEEVESLLEVTELFQNCFSSTLRFLTISKCPKIKYLYGAFEHLSALRSLCISDCPNLLSDKAEEHDVIPWLHLAQTLCSLQLSFCSMKKLPEGMQYLTSLQTLGLWGCLQLKCLPNWMPKLTSLKLLTIRDCSEQLRKRCHQPTGEDWSLIHHVSKVTLM
ncbi:putative disease resistance protein RGA1 [Silene latifolia]|uniref:putative disease resistance protein RGA1 n=1 Tax=Silene latifolia TaxID=37657 RepID=UPI003D76ED72